jgi:hypothetical protein
MSSPIVKAFTGDLFTAAVLLLCLLTFPPKVKHNKNNALLKLNSKGLVFKFWFHYNSNMNQKHCKHIPGNEKKISLLAPCSIPCTG